MKVIIAGSRSGVTMLQVAQAAALFQRVFGNIKRVVSGKCPTGADKLGEEWAESEGIPLISMYANWSTGKGAGPIRNSAMAEVADGLVAIWDGRSPGTLDMITKAERRGLPIVIHHIGKQPYRFEIINPRIDQQDDLFAKPKPKCLKRSPEGTCYYPEGHAGECSFVPF